MENKQLFSLPQQCSSTPVGVVRRIYYQSRIHCDSTGISPTLCWPGCSRFSPVPLNEISIERTALLWCCWLINNATEELKRFPQNAWPRMFPAPLQSLAEMYSCTGGLFWKKCSLNYHIVLPIWEIKWFREYFEATTYTQAVFFIQSLQTSMWVYEKNLIDVFCYICAH